MVLALLIATIPLFALWRFGDLPLDRDYTPYAYPAVFGTPYLKNGHCDIKPPLIHWSYKLWLGILSILRCPWSLNIQLRGMNAALASVATFATAYAIGPREGFMLALLLTSPTLWGFMAQTEILSGCLMVLALTLPSPWNWLALGLMPWANQKNALLVLILFFLLPSPVVSQEFLALLFPSLLFLSVLALSGRLSLAKQWLFDIPKEFGKTRTYRANVLSAAKILIPCLMLLAVPLASMELQSSWALLALVVAGLMVLSKQIVPHHFLLLAVPIAMGSNLTAMGWIGFALIWLWRDGTAWWKPKLTYRIAFPGYLEMMEEAHEIEEWIRKNTKPEEPIWVDGMENQIYFNTGRKACRIEIPELKGLPEGDPPRVIVFCQSGKRDNRGNPLFDYSDYKNVLISPGGRYALMVKM